MAYNANDEQQIKEAKSAAELNDAIRLDVVKNIMSTPSGRGWMYGVLERCHIYNTPFLLGNPDGTAFNCGEQNIGNQLLADVQMAAPDFYMQMIREAKNQK